MAAKVRFRSLETGEGFYHEKNIFSHGSTEENGNSGPDSRHTNAESGIDWSGSIIMTFATANTLSFVSETIVNIGYMFGAIVTIGWIFMSSSRLGDSNDLYTPEVGVSTENIVVVESELQPEPTPVESIEEGVEENVKEDIEEINEEEEDEIEPEDEQAVETTQEPVEAELEIPPPVLMKERVQTQHGFEIELPDDMFNTILASIGSTPHEGFKPVVAFGPRGEVILNFEPQ